MTIFVSPIKATNFKKHYNRMEGIESINASISSGNKTTMTMGEIAIKKTSSIDLMGTEILMKTHNKQENNNDRKEKISNTSDNKQLVLDKDILAGSLVETTVLIIDVIWCNFPLLPNVQVIPLHLYVEETLRRSRTSLPTLQIALLYLLRIKTRIGSIYSNLSSGLNSNSHQNSEPKSDQDTNQNVINVDSATCGRRMFLASLIIASKYLQDKNYSNKTWSNICGLSVKEINSIERRFLQLIVYNLYVSEEMFNNWKVLLDSHIKTILKSNNNNNNNNNITKCKFYNS